LRDYELIVIYKPDISEEKLPSNIEGVSKVITDKGGTITSVNQWGRRKLAYPIEGVIEGNYVLTNFKADTKLITALEKNLKMSETILRHMVVRVEPLPPPLPPPPSVAAAAAAAATAAPTAVSAPAAVAAAPAPVAAEAPKSASNPA